MTRKHALLKFLLTLLIGLLGIVLKVQIARGATQSISIKADGSVFPPDAPISTIDNVTYIFTDNIYGGIIVERDNIIIDGNGYMLQGSGSGDGFYLATKKNVTVQNTVINNFSYGIYLHLSFNNTFLRNTIANNVDYGVVFWAKSANNTFYHNNFINNAQHVFVDTGCVGCNFTNSWGNVTGGNYWSNYTGVDLNHDGIGDAPHEIAVDNTDKYPLMGMFSSFETPSGYRIDITSNSTVEDFEYFESNSTIKIHVSNATIDQTFGFCRLAIPQGLMSPPFNITINDTPVSYTPLYTSETISIIYFSYEHSTVEIIIIPEYLPFVVLPLFMTVTLLAALIYRKKHSYLRVRLK